MEFNQSQSRAVDHFQGPSLVLAGPGSGKTAVITHRVRNLIDKYNVPPENILVVTFSKAAASEMKERFEKIPHNNYLAKGSPTFGTFHGVFFAILKYAYNFDAGNIISYKKKYEILRTLVNRFSLEYEDETAFFETLLSEISRVKSGFVNAEAFIPTTVPPNIFKQIYALYNSRLSEMKLIDFDDMLKLCYDLLSNNPDILSFWQRRFPFALIDEFQDINQIQYEIMKLLTRESRNLFVVGDDDQSIYGFRGASPKIMSQFINDFKDAAQIVLNTNYRSKYPIIEAALKVISQNKKRFQKSIICANTDSSKSSFCLKKYADQSQEYAQISKEILNYRKKGGDISNIAFLFRSNQNATMLIQELIKNDIPVRMSDKPQNIFETFVCKDFITYIKLGMELIGKLPAGSTNREDFFKIMNKPSRYISRQPFNQILNPSAFFGIKKLLDTLLDFYKSNLSVRKSLLQLINHLLVLGNSNPYGAITFIYNGIGYKEYLKEYCSSHRLDLAEYENIVTALLESCQHFSTLKQWEEFMEEYKQNVIVDNDKDIKGVSVMTMHGSKGLEFDIVYIPDLNDGFVPHKKAVSTEEIDEERRIFYVAMTRAKKSLRLSYVEKYHNKKATPSEFLDCLL